MLCYVGIKIDKKLKKKEPSSNGIVILKILMRIKNSTGKSGNKGFDFDTLNSLFILF